ncbi:MAG: MlaD family protein [Gemmatimonadota bacterium]
MKDEARRHRTRRGYALIAGIVLTALLIFNADTLADRFRGYIDLVALVPETTGVRVGSPVTVGGIEAGRVTAIDLAGDADVPVAVRIRVRERVRSALREGSRAETAKRRFIGEPTVQVTVGRPDGALLQPGDTILPTGAPALDLLIAQGKELPSALDTLNALLRQLEEVAGQRRSQLATLTDRLDRATAEADRLRARFEFEGGTLTRLLNDPELPGRLARLQDRFAAVAEAADSAGRYAEGELPARLARVTNRADRVSRALGELSERLEGSGGILVRARRDTAVQRALAEVMVQIDSLRAEGVGFALRMLLP